ncbi:MAG: NAD-dependent alcohol dehydrogenase, partial [Tetragenococcus halophilus]|nr:NAD-dependent alcohol dehydrogenase [Tetragenococcus halophilus]
DMTDRLAKEAMKDPQTIGNPRDLDEDGYKWIYGRCFNQIAKTL